jgi:Family of unknown function (DUF5908)
MGLIKPINHHQPKQNMPIEIRELTIKATLGEETKNTGNSNDGGGEATYEDAVVKACVERVLEIIKAKAER